MEIKLRSPLDMHLHFRDDDMMKLVAPLSGDTFAGGVIMPNLVPPVDNLPRLLQYRERIDSALGDRQFDPYMMLFFRQYSQAELELAQKHILGIKLYPAGATTNSEAGVSEIKAVEPTFKLMEEMGIPLMVHGETHGFVMDREREFLSIYEYLARKFPKLKITMEHITTADAVQLLDRYENLRATVTLQHLIITLDDVAGGMLNPHLFCKPIAKRPEDREALLQAALEAHPKLMFGSDSAPHPLSAKECCGCAAGVFTAPLAVARLAQLFDDNGKLDNLQAFISDNAVAQYGVTPPAKEVTVTKKAFKVPAAYEGFGQTVVPMHAGEELSWAVTDIS
ncbi:dihydroorotase [Persicirhabdus sediminis]|uniref:Dihydroorotase n=1 Tax=Persicirhabdus sediminis TaxID=454144 RepID=A0A8J7MD09_9BACT|nr:dihydroorotase [Persicirhabdus sediminis]MBK1790896.1 dihydroorotase [Persicirhabdus sediminis]